MTTSPKVIEKGENIYELLSASFQVARRLFVLAYFIPANNEAGIKNNKKYFLPREEVKNFNVLTDGRKFYGKPVNDLIKQYDEVRKVSTGHGDGYTTGCLLDYAYFKDSYRLIAVDLSKQKSLDVIQQILFQGVLGGADGTKIRLYTILEKSIETILEFYKGIPKVL